MTNAEAAKIIRNWLQHPQPALFSWPTDGCGYDQHIAFVEYRNKFWKGGTQQQFKEFCEGYVREILQQ